MTGGEADPAEHPVRCRAGSLPRIRTSPEPGVISPGSMWSVVDVPAPLSPSRPTVSPSPTVGLGS
jgi:hypothetical protein